MHSIAVDQMAVLASVALLMSLLLITALLIPWDEPAVRRTEHDFGFAVVVGMVGSP